MKLRLTVNGNGIYIIEKKESFFEGWRYLYDHETEEKALEWIKGYAERVQHDKDKDKKRKQIKFLKIFEIK